MTMKIKDSATVSTCVFLGTLYLMALICFKHPIHSLHSSFGRKFLQQKKHPVLGRVLPAGETTPLNAGCFLWTGDDKIFCQNPKLHHQFYPEQRAETRFLKDVCVPKHRLSKEPGIYSVYLSCIHLLLPC